MQWEWRANANAADPGAISSPVIVVGVTHPQTCLTLDGRLRALRQAGFRVLLVSSPGDLLSQTASREGVEWLSIPMRRGPAPLHDLWALVQLVLLLRRIRPAMTEFSTPKAGLLGGLAAFLCRVPVRIYMLRGLKLETASGLRHRLLLAAERLAAACSHLVLCNSESLRAQARSLAVAPRKKLHLLGEGSTNGVDIHRFRPGPSDVRETLGLAPEDLVVGFVGRLTRDKGVPELVEAFEAIAAAQHRARLLLVGWFDQAEDAVDSALQQRIRSNPRIFRTGFVADTLPYYRAMDLMVLPTWREGFPNVVLEAGATEIPVVTTFATGSRDAVIPEVTGLLIPPGYPEAIREAVLTLLADPDRRRRMGSQARAWIKENFAKAQVLSRTVDLYCRLLRFKTRWRLPASPPPLNSAAAPAFQPAPQTTGTD